MSAATTKRSGPAAVRGRGFTLLEVMIGLALLGLGLVVLIKSTTGNIKAAKRAQMMGVATDLSRGKMYDIEEKLLKDGFTETDQSEDDETFDEEGWPEIKYAFKVEQVELPSLDQLQGLVGAGSGSGAGSDGDASGALENTALFGALANFGGPLAAGGGDIDAAQGASFIQGAYPIVQEGLKASIRKVTLTVKFDVLGEENELQTVAFFTDPAGMDTGILGVMGGAGGGEETPAPGTPGTPKPPTNPRTPTTPGGRGS